MHAEADHAEGEQRQQAERRRTRHLQALALAPARRGEHEEGQHQAGRELDSHTGDQRTRARAHTRARVGACGKCQREGERGQHQRVVVGAADRQHQQHRVQAHERRRPAGGVPKARRRARDERDGREARKDRDPLQRPQPAGQSQWGDGIGGEREQGPIGRVLEVPEGERIGGVGEGFGGHMGVGVEAVQRPHACERQIPEDVLGDQGRAEQEQHVRSHDRARERRDGQRARRGEHQQVARTHHQHERLKGAAREAHVEFGQRTGEPAGPAARTRGDVLRGGSGGAGAHQKDGCEHAEEPQRAERARDSRRRSGRIGAAAPAGCCAFGAAAGYGSRGLDAIHCYVCPACKCLAGPVP